MYDLTTHVLAVTADLVRLADPVEGPDPEDVKAGWGAFAIFIGLCLMVAFLGWALTKQLKRVDRAKAAGVFGDDVEPTDADTTDNKAGTTPPSA